MTNEIARPRDSAGSYRDEFEKITRDLFKDPVNQFHSDVLRTVESETQRTDVLARKMSQAALRSRQGGSIEFVRKFSVGVENEPWFRYGADFVVEVRPSENLTFQRGKDEGLFRMAFVRNAHDQAGSRARSLDLVYRIWWLILGVSGIAWGFVAAASLVGGVGVSPSAAISGVAAVVALMATLFVAGRSSTQYHSDPR